MVMCCQMAMILYRINSEDRNGWKVSQDPKDPGSSINQSNDVVINFLK